jgi:probable dihydroxyacetone kinase regulator
VDRQLAHSLKELACAEPVEKITIKEITDRAGVIRPTFYNHFQDKFELVEWIIRTELLEPVEPLIGNGMIEEGMVLLFSNIERDKAFYTRVVKLEGPVTFHSIAQKCVGEVLLGVIKEQMTGDHAKHKWLTPEIIAGYYAQTMCFAAEEWIKQGMTVSPRELAAAYQYIMMHSMTEVIEGLTKEYNFPDL